MQPDTETVYSRMITELSVENTVETGLNKPLQMEINKFDNIATEGNDIGKTEIRKDDVNVNTSTHKKQTYTPIVLRGNMRGDKLNSPNIMSGEKKSHHSYCRK